MLVCGRRRLAELGIGRIGRPRPSTAAARRSVRPVSASARMTATSTGRLGREPQSRPNSDRPPSDSCRSASSTASTQPCRAHSRPAGGCPRRDPRPAPVDHALDQLRRTRVSNGGQPEMDDARIAIVERRAGRRASRSCGSVNCRRIASDADARIGMLSSTARRRTSPARGATGRAASACSAARTIGRRRDARDDERRDVDLRPPEQIEQPCVATMRLGDEAERFEQRLVAFERQTRQQMIEAGQVDTARRRRAPFRFSGRISLARIMSAPAWPPSGGERSVRAARSTGRR